MYELASKHFGMILPTNYFQMILLCGYPPPPPKNDKYIFKKGLFFELLRYDC